MDEKNSVCDSSDVFDDTLNSLYTTYLDEVEDDVEPYLKYERLQFVEKLLDKSIKVTSLSLHAKLIALGLNNGKIFVLDALGQTVIKALSHDGFNPGEYGSITELSIDHSGEFIASIGFDGSMCIQCISNSDNNVILRTSTQPTIQSDLRPSISLDPLYFQQGSGQRFMSNVNNDTPKTKSSHNQPPFATRLYQKSFFSRYRNLVITTDNICYRIKWRGRFAAWATQRGVRVFDVQDNRLISIIRLMRHEKLISSEYKSVCRITWVDQFHLIVLLGGRWVKYCRIRSRNHVKNNHNLSLSNSRKVSTSSISLQIPQPHHQQHFASVSDGTNLEQQNNNLPQYYVEITTSFCLQDENLLVCGVAPLLNDTSKSKIGEIKWPIIVMLAVYIHQTDDSRPSSSNTTATRSEDEFQVHSMSDKPQLIVVRPTSSKVCKELSVDVLDLQWRHPAQKVSDYDLLDLLYIMNSSNNLKGGGAADEPLYLITTGYDLIVSKPREFDDHITWLVEKGQHVSALHAIHKYLWSEKRDNSLNSSFSNAREIGDSQSYRSDCDSESMFQGGSSLSALPSPTEGNSSLKEMRRRRLFSIFLSVTRKYLNQTLCSDESTPIGDDDSRIVHFNDIAHLSASLISITRNIKWVESLLNEFAKYEKLHAVVSKLTEFQNDSSKKSQNVAFVSASLPNHIYELTIHELIKLGEYSKLLQAIRTFPKHTYSQNVVRKSVMSRLLSVSASVSDVVFDQQSSTLTELNDLHRTLAVIYSNQFEYGKSLLIYLKLDESRDLDVVDNPPPSETFDTLLNVIHGHVQEQQSDNNLVKVLNTPDIIKRLFQIDLEQSVTFYTTHVRVLPPSNVLNAINLLDVNHNRYIEYSYLDTLYVKSVEFCRPHLSLLIELYAIHSRSKFSALIHSNEAYPVEYALKVCTASDSNSSQNIDDRIYLLSRIGSTSKALDLITRDLGDVDRAIEFCQSQNDDQLWSQLIDFSVDKPTFVSALLQQIGNHIENPLLLITRIRPGQAIEGLRDSLVKIIRDYRCQVSLVESCRDIIISDTFEMFRKQISLANRCEIVPSGSFSSSCGICGLGTGNEDDSSTHIFKRCGHAFHEKCVDNDGLMISSSCPICKPMKEQ